MFDLEEASNHQRLCACMGERQPPDQVRANASLQQAETMPISSESRVTSSGIQQVTTKAVSDKQEPDSTSNSTSDPNTDTDSKG